MTASNQVSGAVLQMNQFKSESSSFWYVHHISDVSAAPGYAGGGGIIRGGRARIGRWREGRRAHHLLTSKMLLSQVATPML